MRVYRPITGLQVGKPHVLQTREALTADRSRGHPFDQRAIQIYRVPGPGANSGHWPGESPMNTIAIKQYLSQMASEYKPMPFEKDIYEEISASPDLFNTVSFQGINENGKHEMFRVLSDGSIVTSFFSGTHFPGYNRGKRFYVRAYPRTRAWYGMIRRGFGVEARRDWMWVAQFDPQWPQINE